MLTPLQKLPKNVRDLGKLIVAKGLKKLPKVQKIAHSGHTVGKPCDYFSLKNGPSSAPFSFIFLFSNKHYNSYYKYMSKNVIVHPVYGIGIRTYDLCNTSLLP